MNRNRVIAWAPLALAVLLGAALSYGLAKPDDRTIASQMIGASVPDFSLPPATAQRPALSSAVLRDGHPHLLNFFASWCVPCAAEAPQLGAIAAAGVPVVGIAVRDRPDELDGFLRRNGNPYRNIGGDLESRVAMDFGSSGVPESFLVDGKGRILRQVIGPIGSDEAATLVATARGARS